MGGIDQPGRIQDIGARVAIRDEPLDRVGQIVDAVQVILGAGGQHQAMLPGRFDCRRYALGGDVDGIDRSSGGVVVLDRTARRPGFREQLHGPGDATRVIGEAPLRIHAERHVDSGGKRLHVRDELVATDVLIGPPERRRVTRARGRDRLEPEGGEQPSRADVPGVRHDEQPFAMQGAETLAAVELGVHGYRPHPLLVARSRIVCHASRMPRSVVHRSM